MALALDASSPAFKATTTSGTTAASNSFTPPAGSLIVLCVAQEVLPTPIVSSVTDTGSRTWSKIGSFSDTVNDVDFEFWCADAGASPSSTVVTAHYATSQNSFTVNIAVYTGAAPAASQNGATVGTRSSSTSVVSANLTTTHTGSIVIAYIGAALTAGFTVASGQTDTFGSNATFNSSTDDWVQQITSPAGASGTVVTIATTTQTFSAWTICIAEILAAFTTVSPPSIPKRMPLGV